MDSIDRLAAARPVLVHFFDFAQLNSVRTLPYLRAWYERYSRDGLAMIGIHSPRFPFTQDYDVVADAAERLEIGWPVIVDREFSLWRLYEPHGWPALFLWGRGGALRWYHLGEGEYRGHRGGDPRDARRVEWRARLAAPARAAAALRRAGREGHAPDSGDLPGWLDRGALAQQSMPIALLDLEYEAGGRLRRD